MNKNTQSGFGVVEVILSLVIVGVVGFIGWRMYEAQKANPAPTNDVQSQINSNNNVSDDSQAYSSEVLGVAFSYPKDWLKLECDGRPESVYFASDGRGLGMNNGTSILCGSGGTDFPAQVSVRLRDGAEYTGRLTAENAINLAGREGYKIVAVQDGQTSFLPAGFETTSYIFKLDTNKYFELTYNKWPTGNYDYDTSSESKQKFIDLFEKSLRFL